MRLVGSRPPLTELLSSTPRDIVARFNEILVGRYNRLFQKLFSIKATAPVPTLSTEIQPQLGAFSGEENRYLEGWLLFGIGIEQPGVAAQTSTIRMRNPAGSNIIAVITSIGITCSPSAGLFSRFGPVSVDLATLQNPTRLDARHADNSSILFSRTTNGTTFGGNIGIYNPQTLTPFFFSLTEFPLLPGDGFQIDTGQANITLDVNILFRQRFLEESERT